MMIRTLARTPCIHDLTPTQVRITGAVRLWALTAKAGRCPLFAVTQRLGEGRAGAHLHLMMEQIGAAWPDPFCVSPPCSPRLSHDEAALAGMFAYAACRDRAGFDRMLSDLLPFDARERLYLSAVALSRSFDA